MRKITQDAVHAFHNGYNFKRDNTRVVKEHSGLVTMYLHGNCIATNGFLSGIMISNGGWSSNTTKERLNGVIGRGRIVQRNHQWYLDGKAWDGSPILIKD